MIFVMQSKLRDTSFPHQIDLSSKVHRTPASISSLGHQFGEKIQCRFSYCSESHQERSPTHVLNKRDHIIEVSREQMLH